MEGQHAGYQPYMATAPTITPYPSIFREPPYHSMFSSSLHATATTDPYSAALMGATAGYDSYSNMGYGYMSPYYRYVTKE